MEFTDVETKIEAEVLQEIQDLVILRKQKYTQQKMATYLKRSLKTIQNFENYKSRNLNMYMGYKILLKQTLIAICILMSYSISAQKLTVENFGHIGISVHGPDTFYTGILEGLAMTNARQNRVVAQTILGQSMNWINATDTATTIAKNIVNYAAGSVTTMSARNNTVGSDLQILATDRALVTNFTHGFNSGFGPTCLMFAWNDSLQRDVVKMQIVNQDQWMCELFDEVVDSLIYTTSGIRGRKGQGIELYTNEPAQSTDTMQAQHYSWKFNPDGTITIPRIDSFPANPMGNVIMRNDGMYVLIGATWNKLD